MPNIGEVLEGNLSCPHCGRELPLSSAWLDQVNRLCGDSSYHEPENRVGPYRLFFREYIPAPDTTMLVGSCLALHENREKSGFYTICGSGVVQELTKGVNLEFGEASDIPRVSDPPSMFIEAKRRSMADLTRYMALIVNP